MRLLIVLIWGFMLLSSGSHAQETGNRYLESEVLELQQRGQWYRTEAELVIPFDEKQPVVPGVNPLGDASG